MAPVVGMFAFDASGMVAADVADEETAATAWVAAASYYLQISVAPPRSANFAAVAAGPYGFHLCCYSGGCCCKRSYTVDLT